MIDFSNFPENTSVLLIDHETGITHDIKSEAYSFIVSDLGINEIRFEIRYQTNALAIDEPTDNANVYVSVQEQYLYVYGIGEEKFLDLSIYDVLGKQVINTSFVEKTDRYAKTLLNSLQSGIYFIEIKTDEKTRILQFLIAD